MSLTRPLPVRQRLVVLALVGVLLGGGSATLVYELTKGPTLVVTDGSITGVIQGNLTSISSVDPLVLHFSMTTYANQSGFQGSTVTFLLIAETYYDAASGSVLVTMYITVLGQLATDFRPTGMVLSYNQAGPDISVNAVPGGYSFMLGYQAPYNVSFNASAGFGFDDNGTGTLSVALVNQGGPGPYYRFCYPAEVGTMALPQYNHVLGLRVDLAGLGTAFGVGIVLEVINTSGGIWA